MGSLLDWLITPAIPAASGAALVLAFAAVCLLGFMLAAFIAGPGAPRVTPDPELIDAVRERARAALWLTGTSVLFVAICLFQIEALWLSWPIWLILTAFVLLVFLIRVSFWWKTTAGDEVAAWREATK